MLRTNLSTRPFYNERGIHVGLALAAIVVIGLTVFNLTQIVILTRQQADLNERAVVAETRAQQLLAHAGGVRRELNPKEMDQVSSAAREANTLIGERLFSWTELLNRLETTLPDDVRITSMRPIIDKDGKVVIAMTVLGRRVEDVNQFMQNLEGTGAFTDAFTRDETSTEDGLRQASIEAHYRVK
jgi:Tfp pilus assembly protein PilN